MLHENGTVSDERAPTELVDYNKIRTLITYMSIWGTQKRLLLADKYKITKE